MFAVSSFSKLIKLSSKYIAFDNYKKYPQLKLYEVKLYEGSPKIKKY